MDVLCTFKIKIESQNSNNGYIKDQWPYPNQDQDAIPQSGTSSILQGPKIKIDSHNSDHMNQTLLTPKWGLKGHGCSLHLQNQDREPIFKTKVYQKTSDHVQIKIKMSKPSQEPTVSSKAPNEDLKDIDGLCTLKIKIESQNLDHGFIKVQGTYSC